MNPSSLLYGSVIPAKERHPVLDTGPESITPINQHSRPEIEHHPLDSRFRGNDGV